MIEADLIHYLRHTEQVSDAVTQKRLNAIRMVRHYVGDRMSIGRTPRRGGSAYLQITKVAEDRQDDLGGNDVDVQTTLQVDVWTKGDGAAVFADQIAKSIYIAISSYHGKWDKTTVFSATQERDTVVTEDPDDGTRYWDYRDSRDYLVTWLDADIASEE